MAKRKAAPISQQAPRKKRCTTQKEAPAWTFKPKDWILDREIVENEVALLRSRTSRGLFIVRKIVKLDDTDTSDDRPREVKVLEQLPRCNRIVHLLGLAPRGPKDGEENLLFQYYPMGDLKDWRERICTKLNHKPVPESYMWRFLIQMTQAVAFIHNELGPNRDNRGVLLHRDIKPKNVLVYSNGTTYPSFKLHDFGCARFMYRKMPRTTIAGTYEWQAPEIPHVNTKAADVWAAGACLHFLAVGEAPVQNVERHMQRVVGGNGGIYPNRPSMADYANHYRYYCAKVPREVTAINLSPAQQETVGIAPYNSPDRPTHNAEYTDALNTWMNRILHFTPSERPSAGQLVTDLIPVAREWLKKMTGKSGLVDLEIKFET
ncbi:serine/threonine protein kinase-like protein [Clohesyomyces aquaticus]|uniref:non-specific serine/threonine protein kinase n=1 Tax=Clohesyomyces aquaticus TaxID=1231657 RepID=A0A1Y1ZRR8_9PLEO|nr:serine/threonine protein kinase-like protein [Clohesyomyces aquaticus]